MSTNNKKHILPIVYIQEMNFLYLDTEYLRDLEKHYIIDLYTIQWFEFTFKDLLENKVPTINILTRWEEKTEEEMLKKFYPVWKRIFLPQRDEKKIFIYGFFVETDLNLLKRKYHNLGKEFREGTYYERNLRYIDLQQLARYSTGLLDPRLSTTLRYLGLYNSNINNEDLDVRNLLETIEKSPDKTNKNALISYITQESKNNFQLLHYYFGKDYKINQTDTQKQAIKLQEEQSSEKYFFNKNFNKNKPF